MEKVRDTHAEKEKEKRDRDHPVDGATVTLDFQPLAPSALSPASLTAMSGRASLMLCPSYSNSTVAVTGLCHKAVMCTAC